MASLVTLSGTSSQQLNCDCLHPLRSLLFLLLSCLTLFIQYQAFTSCEHQRGFPRHLTARGFNYQRTSKSQTT